MYVALKMNGEAGEFAEHVGKAIRDDSFSHVYDIYDELTDSEYRVSNIETHLTKDRHDLLVKEIGDILWYLAAAARELGTDLSTIAHGNNVKLVKRKVEGKLGGSGDNR